MNFYQMGLDVVVQRLKTDIQKGLSSDDARQRLDIFGYNEIPHKELTSVWIILIKSILKPINGYSDSCNDSKFATFTHSRILLSS